MRASAHASPAVDPLLGVTPTASMRATFKFFWLIGAVMLVLQMGAGILTAHYGVEGTALYGLPIANWIPYSLIPYLACTAGSLLDSHGLVGYRAVFCTYPRWTRTSISTIWHQRLCFGLRYFVVAGSLVGQGLAIAAGAASQFPVGTSGI